jgi:23S rRNA (cytidine1920-2'-O)/16S rRNA (cytidine1409-2'-O)-methyltransferase
VRPAKRFHACQVAWSGSMASRQRVDRVLVERGLFESRARAQAAIAAGLVSVDGVVVCSASDPVPAAATIVAAPEHPYVSRGALKLAAALDHFHIDVADYVCVDVGASTGGFSEVLVQRGARLVYAVDVGHGQLHVRLRAHPAIVSMEQTDIRTLDPALLPERPNFAAVDVSFISLKLVLPAVGALLQPRAAIVALIKPQFEVGPGETKKGIVRDAIVRERICEDIAAFLSAQGWRVGGHIPSPIRGGDGNREILIEAERG